MGNLLVEKEIRLQEALDAHQTEVPGNLSVELDPEPQLDTGELTRVVEQLTSMLSVSQRQLSTVSSELVVERRLRQELVSEMTVLKSRAAEPTSGGIEERARREAIEECLRQATAKRGGRFYPHLEV